MNKSFAELPAKAVFSVRPFEVTIPEDSLLGLKILLEHSPVAAPTYESMQKHRKYGITRKWLEEAKNHWMQEFDWLARSRNSAI